jgi:hypothetical protein
MLYILTFIIFAFALGMMVFANDGYLNSELDAYQRCLKEPWLERIVALRYDYVQ